MIEIVFAWCLWALAAGWAASTAYHWTQDHVEETFYGAIVILLLMLALAIITSIAVGVETDQARKLLVEATAVPGR